MPTRSSPLIRRRVFAEILAVTAALGAAACARAGAPASSALPDEADGDWSEVMPYGMLEEVKVDPPIDYLGEHEEKWPASAGVEAGPWRVHSHVGFGTPCATAEDAAACRAKFAGIRVLPVTARDVRKVPGRSCTKR